MSNHKLTKNEVMQLVNSVIEPQVRCGEDHGFTTIWMVELNGRIFSRASRTGRRGSWFDAFVEAGEGTIRLNDTVINVKGVIPEDKEALALDLNEAYYQKYSESHPELMGMLTIEAIMNNTIEFIYPID